MQGCFGCEMQSRWNSRLRSFMKAKEDQTFATLVAKIGEREIETITGQWFNLVLFRHYRFIQGHIIDHRSKDGGFRSLAALVHDVSPDAIEGFWPEVKGRAIRKREESFLRNYLAAQNENDVELIIPLRNIARAVDWDRFDESREFPIYVRHIYPLVLSTLRNFKFRRVLDVGCGTGDLIEAILASFPYAECHGFDINPDNIDAAREKGIPNLNVGDAEYPDELLPGKMTFDVLLFCGLLNRQVTDREKASGILAKCLPRLEKGGHIIITGYSSCHFSASDLESLGITLYRKSLPGNLFKDYSRYHLRQFYAGQKT